MTPHERTKAASANWLWRLIARYAFARGYTLVPTHEIEWLEASAHGDYAALKKHPRDSWERGYFNGMADVASKISYKLTRYYPSPPSPPTRSDRVAR